jgi:DNA-directed RNA polymerase subunit RPC12/RpoP
MQYKTIYKCGHCGATSYRPVIDRDSTGALTPSGVYRCTGCRVTFEDLRDWWGHDGAGLAVAPADQTIRTAS